MLFTLLISQFFSSRNGFPRNFKVKLTVLDLTIYDCVYGIEKLGELCYSGHLRGRKFERISWKRQPVITQHPVQLNSPNKFLYVKIYKIRYCHFNYL